ncbi:MAG: hypothetical protein Q9M91_01645 [Candidatus Dojkabacteria bacterium]|nr:hypothetical protein [Candidatus Dojkabacteria bacterium]
MRLHLTSGIVYRLYNSKDTDKVVVIINNNGEKESLLAKGIKKVLVESHML